MKKIIFLCLLFFSFSAYSSEYVVWENYTDDLSSMRLILIQDKNNLKFGAFSIPAWINNSSPEQLIENLSQIPLDGAQIIFRKYNFTNENYGLSRNS